MCVRACARLLCAHNPPAPASVSHRNAGAIIKPIVELDVVYVGRVVCALCAVHVLNEFALSFREKRTTRSYRQQPHSHARSNECQTSARHCKRIAVANARAQKNRTAGPAAHVNSKTNFTHRLTTPTKRHTHGAPFLSAAHVRKAHTHTHMRTHVDAHTAHHCAARESNALVISFIY